MENFSAGKMWVYLKDGKLLSTTPVQSTALKVCHNAQCFCVFFASLMVNHFIAQNKAVLLYSQRNYGKFCSVDKLHLQFH